MSGEPSVINKELITRLAIEQIANNGETRKITHFEDEEQDGDNGIEIRELREIRIEFMNILRIDNLWILSDRLTRLKLSNNIIEKIENLDTLVNLIELDLSFNHIRVMENLETLVNLEILLLHENEITEIDGIEAAIDRLTILSIGANKIQHSHHVLYLRRFNKLRVFNVTGNPCTLKDDYWNNLVAFLPQIEYLNYKMITREERQIAYEEYHLVEKEDIEKVAIKEKQKRKERLALLSLSYVEYLDDNELFEHMYKDDKEGKELSMMNDDSRAAYERYNKIFGQFCFQLYEIGVKEYDKRQKEFNLFTKNVDEARGINQTEARIRMEEIDQRKSEIFMEIGKLVESIAVLKEPDETLRADIEEKQIDEAKRLSEEFNSLLSKTWNQLMYRELILHEQIEEINESFKINMGDMVRNFLDSARGIFAQIRNAETEYKDNLESVCNALVDNATDDQTIGNNDRDAIVNNIAASHDIHLQTIDAREDCIVSGINNWYETCMENLAQEENQRNRRRILEISHFLDHQREEFDNLQLKLQSSAGD